MSAPAHAQINVEKEITRIQFPATDLGPAVDTTDVAGFLNSSKEVPPGTVITFDMTLTVTANTDQDLTEVVVTDRFGGDVSVECVGCVLETKGKTEKQFLTWTVDSLDSGESASLPLKVTSDMNPGSNQNYSECGPHELNSGPTAKGRVARTLPSRSHASPTRQVSHDGASITITVACTECSDGIDNDMDTFIDQDDIDCSSALDDTESCLACGS
jgi:hypothetical protein